MTISTRDQLINAMANNSTSIYINKTSSSSNAAGVYRSYWRETGTPGQGAIPTAVATCNNNTIGGIPFAQQTSPATSYLAFLEYSFNVPQTLELHDRLAHFGGLNGTLTTAQTVNLDLSALLSTDNLSERLGDSNYRQVQWWLEWYTATGATAVTATVNVTYNNGTTGNLTALSLATNRGAGFMANLNAQIPAASAGLYIRAVNSVTLSATTGTAGNFGVTATRLFTSAFSVLGNAKAKLDWAQTGLPKVANASCIFMILLPVNTTSTGLVALGKIAHG